VAIRQNSIKESFESGRLSIYKPAFHGDKDMVRAIDMQQVITQAYPAEKVQQTQQQHADIQQRYFDLKLNEEQKLLREKITDAEEARGTKIAEKEGGRGEQREMGKRKRDARQDTDKTKGATELLSDEGSIIDIKA
jgi:hypothetical protein